MPLRSLCSLEIVLLASGEPMYVCSLQEILFIEDFFSNHVPLAGEFQ